MEIVGRFILIVGVLENQVARMGENGFAMNPNVTQTLNVFRRMVGLLGNNPEGGNPKRIANAIEHAENLGKTLDRRENVFRALETQVSVMKEIGFPLEREKEDLEAKIALVKETVIDEVVDIADRAYLRLTRLEMKYLLSGAAVTPLKKRISALNGNGHSVRKALETYEVARRSAYPVRVILRPSFISLLSELRKAEEREAVARVAEVLAPPPPKRSKKVRPYVSKEESVRRGRKPSKDEGRRGKKEAKAKR